MTRWRRSADGNERRCDVFEAMVHVSTGALLIRRIAHPRSFSNGLLGTTQAR
jgi:hypothetical protein